jgi:hypothetical protein
MAQTNFEGQASLSVELYNVWYKLIYSDTDGNVYKTTDPSPFFDIASTDVIQLIDDSYEGFRKYTNAVTNVSFETAGNSTYARFIWTATDSIVREACLRVDFIATGGDLTNVFYNCTEAAAGLITYVIDTSLEGQYKAVGMLDTNTTNSWQNVGTLFYGTTIEAVSLGREGIFYSAIIIGTVAFMGLATITGSMILFLMALIGVTFTGILTGWQLSYLYFIIILGLIIIYLIRRGSK